MAVYHRAALRGLLRVDVVNKKGDLLFPQLFQFLERMLLAEEVLPEKNLVVKDAYVRINPVVLREYNIDSVHQQTGVDLFPQKAHDFIRGVAAAGPLGRGKIIMG